MVLNISGPEGPVPLKRFESRKAGQLDRGIEAHIGKSGCKLRVRSVGCRIESVDRGYSGKVRIEKRLQRRVYRSQGAAMSSSAYRNNPGLSHRGAGRLFFCSGQKAERLMSLPKLFPHQNPLPSVCLRVICYRPPRVLLPG